MNILLRRYFCLQLYMIGLSCLCFIFGRQLITLKDYSPVNSQNHKVDVFETHFRSKDQLYFVNNTQMEDEMKKRIRTLKKNCQIITHRKRSTYGITLSKIPIAIKANKHHLCKVPKCGSTYWAQVFLTLKGIVKVNQFENIDRESIHGPLQEKIILRDWRPISSNKLILVTRNPWNRIYSAYMDKIFRLQSSYIGQVKKMLNTRRYCGEIPSFEQFLKYIIHQYYRGSMLDPHWRPISTLCRVCKYTYTYILKMESFVKDSSYVLDKIVPEEFKDKNDLYAFLTTKHGSDDLSKLVRQFTAELKERDKCFSFIDTMKRLWISLQSQGLISDDVKFDAELFSGLSQVDENKIVDIFISKSKEKRLSSIDKKIQRESHFRKAYETIDFRVLKTIQVIYDNDFLLFGYKRELPL